VDHIAPEQVLEAAAFDAFMCNRPGLRDTGGEGAFRIFGQQQAAQATGGIGKGGSNGVQAVEPNRAAGSLGCCRAGRARGLGALRAPVRVRALRAPGSVGAFRAPGGVRAFLGAVLALGASIARRPVVAVPLMGGVPGAVVAAGALRGIRAAEAVRVAPPLFGAAGVAARSAEAGRAGTRGAAGAPRSTSARRAAAGAGGMRRFHASAGIARPWGADKPDTADRTLTTPATWR
jgi:hypothetical protein